MDQSALDKTQASQLFNDLQWRLIASINTQRQASNILMTNRDCMADHKFSLNLVLTTAHSRAFMLREDRDLFKLEPAPVIFGDLDPN